MKNEQQNYLLDEPLADRKMMGWIAMLIVVGVIAGSASGNDLDWNLRLAVIAGVCAFFALVIGLEYLLYLRRMRLRMDENRVWTHIPLTKERSLEWKQMRTAAIVHLRNTNYPDMIVLSIHEPKDVLTRKRMVWKNPKRGEEMRFPLTESRRAVVEERLNMTLPEINL